MIEINKIRKTYHLGENEVNALREVSLKIDEGDYVAIMGPSGSGKSTLMHILGLLDVPSAGSYRIDGREVAGLSEDELAVLRREAIGFIFQQFNLLSRLSAEENVGLPLLYSQNRIDLERARELLGKVGLSSRASHRPNELSGGQQQRVAISRSLVNRPRMILADEPTGNLDSQSEKEILGVLRELNSQGITVVVVTHEEEVGREAHRIIRMRDGLVQSDERLRPIAEVAKAVGRAEKPGSGSYYEGAEYIRQGFKTLMANKVRTALSMLGILIGVAAVVAMLAIGRGAQRDIEERLSSLGSNLLVLRTGAVRRFGVTQETGVTTRLTLTDAESIKEKIPSIRESAPSVNGRVQISYQNKNWSTQVTGTMPAYARIRASEPAVGRFFTEEENRRRSRVAVLGSTVVKELFADANPIGENVKINKVIFQVVGILPEKGGGGFRDQDDVILVPLFTAMYRLLGKPYVDSIDIEIDDIENMAAAESSIEELMLQRHRVALSQKQGAFEIRNMADIQEALSESGRTMSLLLASIAAISLLVGGIGIMNIMLVSVTERTKEVGLRKAIGARRRDILTQFLAESIVVSVVGGLIGILLGWGLTLVVTQWAGWSTSVSPGSVLLAFFFSGTIGVVFGIYPARKASRLHPIDALRHD